jgi:hypothetical protein
MRRSITFILLLAVFFASCAPAVQPTGITVLTHPDGPLYLGDRVSFEVIPGTVVMDGLSLQVREGDHPLGTAGFGPFGVGGRNEAIFWWTWDTRSLQPGRHTLTFTTSPQGPSWIGTYILHPAKDVPPPEPEAHWTSTTSACCTLYYITGSDAARDIESLKGLADGQAADVEHKLGADFISPVSIVFMSRTLGHGGFTNDSVYVSYLDRNYAGSTTAQVLHHELTHLLDSQLGGGYKPSVLVEGLAVYISGGHFKQEPLLPRAAALFDMGWYIPLKDLTDNFYPQQHEVGYLEAGALIQYMVEKYGWSAFDDFYRHLPDPGQRTPSEELDAALRTQFGISLSDLETDLIASLKTQAVTADIRADLRLSVRFYDTVRRYQQDLDPSAYYLTAWLPDGKTMRDQGIVADYLRHPDGWKNRLIEPLLVRADKELRLGEYVQVEKTLDWINWLLDVAVPRITYIQATGTCSAPNE